MDKKNKKAHKRKDRSSFISPILKYKKMLLGKLDLSDSEVFDIIDDIRKFSKTSAISNHIFKELLTSQKVFRDCFERLITSRDLNFSQYMLVTRSDSSIDDNLNFICIALTFQVERLKVIVAKKRLMEQSLLYLKKDEVDAQIKDLIDVGGTGIWIVATKLSSLFFMGDDKEVIDFRNSLPEGIDSFSESLLLYEILKARTTTTYHTYSHSVNRQLEDIRFNGIKYVDEHLKFVADFDPNDTYKGLEVLLSLFSLHRLTDLFFLVLRTLKYCYIHRINVDASISTLISIQTEIESDELDLVLAKHTGDYVGKYENEECLKKISEFYLKEEYEDVFKNYIDIFLKKPSTSYLYEILSNSSISCESGIKLPPLVNEIIILFSNLKLKVNVEKSLSRLSVIFLNLKQFDWAYHLKAKIEKFSYDGNKSKSACYDFSDLGQIRISPFDLETLYRLNNDSQTSVVIDYFETTPVIQKYLKDCFNKSEFCSVDIPVWRFVKSKAEHFHYLSEHENCLVQYEKLNDLESESLCPIETSARLIESLFLNGEVEKSIKLMAAKLLKGEDFSVFPLDSISRHISKTVNKNVDLEVLESCSIVLHFYNLKYPGNDVTQVISNLVERMIKLIGIEEPSKITPKNWPLSTFILSHVMTIDVLDGFVFLFENDLEIYVTKMNVCKSFLAGDVNKHDITFLDHIYNEYSSAFNRMILQLCSSEMSEGRIKVDKESLKVFLLDELSPVFNELERGITDEQIEFIDIKHEFGSATISGNKSVGAIADAILKIFTEYTVNKLFGLDNCLNMKFRHGEIRNHLWSVLRQQNIQGKKLSPTEYDVDTVFDDYKLFNSDTIAALKLNHSTFLVKLQNIIFEFRARCSVDSADFIGDEKKFFNFPVNSQFFLEFINQFNIGKSLSALLEFTFSWLDDETEKLLEQIKSSHIPNLKSEVIGLYDQYLSSLEAAPFVFKNKISFSKNEIESRLDELSTWFDWVGEPTSPFNFGAVHDKSIEIVHSLYPSMNIRRKYEDQTGFLIKPNLFTTFVTILCLALENAVEHCGNDRHVNISTAITNGSNKLQFSIKNTVSIEQSKNLPSIVKKINEDLSNNFIERAAKESGSGIFKIKTLLVDRMKAEPDMHVSITDKHFILEFTLADSERIIYENSDS